ncbi:Molybdopterin-binding protein ModE [Methanonatronarchaeum thermophilum]|uniref:Molybdopterin-binding protein ModE n=1 Tax=Methanonatronarchaeum thermophilum TaxID=1927129 RepID=A0A1Y3GAR1_9EURY|nr:TOBE domain-containing protein [Methanonatronarchaeum thermophilum]OUJ18330.1 Molybdopterin-binding protein ModE [Methanonatronarchaeum thermophilum]
MKREPIVEVYIRSGDTKFRYKDLELLKSIEEYGSINRASKVLSRSYSHSQKRIDRLENAFGRLIDRRRGGVDGGGSELTSLAEQLVETLENKITDLVVTADTEMTVVEGRVVEMDRDLAVIDTSIGRLNTIKKGWMELGQVTRVLIRADIITLQDPGRTRRTSALNTVLGEVVGLDRSESGGTAIVYLEVGGTTIKAVVTKNSIKNLDITRGKELTATFKATATKVIPDAKLPDFYNNK